MIDCFRALFVKNNLAIELTLKTFAVSAPVSPKSVKFQDEIARDLRRQQQKQAPAQQSIGPRRSSAFQPPSSNAQYAVPHTHRHQSVPAQKQQPNPYDEFDEEEPVQQRSLHQPLPEHFAPLPPPQRIGVLQQKASEQLQNQQNGKNVQQTPVKVVQPKAVRPPEPTKPFQPMMQRQITSTSTINPPTQAQLKVSPVSQQMTSSFTSDLGKLNKKRTENVYLI